LATGPGRAEAGCFRCHHAPAGAGSPGITPSWPPRWLWRPPPAQKAHLLHRPVQLQGQWLAEQTSFWTTARCRAGRLLCAHALQLSAPHDRVVIVVQRGWAPRNFMDRTACPRCRRLQAWSASRAGWRRRRPG
jgi:hypothetical protein